MVIRFTAAMIRFITAVLLLVPFVDGLSLPFASLVLAPDVSEEVGEKSRVEFLENRLGLLRERRSDAVAASRTVVEQHGAQDAPAVRRGEEKRDMGRAAAALLAREAGQLQPPLPFEVMTQDDSAVSLIVERVSSTRERSTRKKLPSLGLVVPPPAPSPVEPNATRIVVTTPNATGGEAETSSSPDPPRVSVSSPQQVSLALHEPSSSSVSSTSSDGSLERPMIPVGQHQSRVLTLCV